MALITGILALVAGIALLFAGTRPAVRRQVRYVLLVVGAVFTAIGIRAALGLLAG